MGSSLQSRKRCVTLSRGGSGLRARRTLKATPSGCSCCPGTAQQGAGIAALTARCSRLTGPRARHVTANAYPWRHCSASFSFTSCLFVYHCSPPPEHLAGWCAQSNCLSPLSAVTMAVTQSAASPTSHLSILCSSCCSHVPRHCCLQSKVGILSLLLATFHIAHQQGCALKHKKTGIWAISPQSAAGACSLEGLHCPAPNPPPCFHTVHLQRLRLPTSQCPLICLPLQTPYRCTRITGLQNICRLELSCNSSATSSRAVALCPPAEARAHRRAPSCTMGQGWTPPSEVTQALSPLAACHSIASAPKMFILAESASSDQILKAQRGAEHGVFCWNCMTPALPLQSPHQLIHLCWNQAGRPLRAAAEHPANNGAEQWQEVGTSMQASLLAAGP